MSPGFDMANVLTLRVTSSWAEGDMRVRAKRTVDFLETIPGVERAAIGVSYPGVPTQYPLELTVLEGRGGDQPTIMAESRFVSEGYFDVMRIPLLKGEPCREEPGETFVSGVVNRSFANTYFPGEEAIGHNLQIPGGGPPVRIRGIVGDARENGVNRAPAPVFYYCALGAQPNTYYMVRTRTDASAMSDVLRRKLRELEPTRSVYDITPLEARLDSAFSQNRLRTVLLASFAVIAVSLACVGLYGTLSYLVNLRRREVGLRLALGAVRSGIIGHFFSRGLTVTGIGCAAGIALGAAFTRFLSGMLFGVSPWDPMTFAGVIAAMLAVAAVASLLPALRAARVEPMQVLREN